jgi:hemoglobin/transferrin/lactoferrin receptor protein
MNTKVLMFAVMLSLVFSLPLPGAAAGGIGAFTGIVRDPSGLPIQHAQVDLLSPQGAHILRLASNATGSFLATGLLPGEYLVEIRAPQFAEQRQLLRIDPEQEDITIYYTLSLAPVESRITVMASPGVASEIGAAPQMAAAMDGEALRARPLPTIGAALSEHAGIHVQESARGQVSPFLRGFTGFHVLNLLDGIRFNNTTFRFGPNQYLAFIDPSVAQTMETTLGPASSEYGSDALGGAIHILTPGARFSSTARPEIGGRVGMFFNSSDLSTGASAQISLSGRRISLLAGGAWRRHNSLRAGGGVDSHNALTRLMGLSGEQVQSLLGTRLHDTAFSQAGGYVRGAWKISARQMITAWYQQSEQDGVRGYKDLWGGLGKLQSRFEPQGLNLFYVRHMANSLGPIDSLSSTFSINAQSDGSMSQGLRLSDPAIVDRTQVDAYGYSAQARMHHGSRRILVFGGELYDERVDSLRLVFPSGSRYVTAAAYAQTSWESEGRRLRAQAGGRLTQVRFQSRRFADATFNLSASARLVSCLHLHAVVSRGFRAPNLNDLGTMGLQDLGYEVPAESLRDSGALIGDSSGESAVSTGWEVGTLGSEKLMNYEAGLSWRRENMSARANVFDAEYKDAIARRTVLFPAGGMPQQIAGIPVHALTPTERQAAEGVATAATDLDARAVKAFVNVGRQRFRGMEAELRRNFPRNLAAGVNYSFLYGRELDPQRYVRRLPPQSVRFFLTYRPPSRYWMEVSMEAAGAQRLLSGGDLSDERIGAERSRNDIAAFFTGGRLSPYVAGGIFTPTGETLQEIQDRVLPRSVAPLDTTRVPLFTSTPGFAVFHIRAGLRFWENSTVTIDCRNLLDRNYRGHGSGIDAPGRSLFIAWEHRF